MCSLSQIYKTSISVFVLFIANFAQAQDTAVNVANDTVVKDSLVVNKSMKLVFEGLKNNNNDSTLTTFIIIGIVLAIVGVAMYMSFKDPDKAKG